MNKKTYVLAALISLLFLATNAFALDYADVYFTGAPGNTSEKTNFIYQVEQPWLFIKFYDGVALDSEVGKSTYSTMEWDTPATGDADLLRFWPLDNSTIVNTNGIWMSLPSEDDWRSVEQLGNWTVDVETLLTRFSGFPRTVTYSGTAGFTVSLVPEPIAATLFVLGGGVLIATRRLRKG
ncbi:MAG: hypothetical protein PHT59_00215 [Candidatus Omnitrophica bacterium]|nr:hypothetical protein [Candidatus Omnitrophota bacterium]